MVIQKPMVKERITSIDALRAVTLLGILLVHTSGMFGWGAPKSSTLAGTSSQFFISFFLAHRCNTIFGILFGVSFYLILRNPTYTTRKFVWRCFLLVLIGLFNKLFYTYDALMWYGILGMVLACFRRLPTKKLFVAFVVVYLLNFVIQYSVDLKEIVFGSNSIGYNRYKDANGLGDVLRYPLWMSVLDYIKAVIKSPLGCLSKFLLGYCIAKAGIIENLQKHVTIRNFLIFTSLYIVLVFVGLRFHFSVVKSIGYLSGSFCYALLFLLVYYKTYPFFRFLEPYGKLGLTNYSMQGVIGVIMTALVFIPYHWPFEYVLMTMLVFYIIQVLFSIVWLKHNKYGPFEWIWRCATEKQWIRNRIKE